MITTKPVRDCLTVETFFGSPLGAYVQALKEVGTLWQEHLHVHLLSLEGLDRYLL